MSKYQEDFPKKIVEYFNCAKTQKQVISKSARYNKDGVLISEEEKYKIVPTDMPTFSGFARSVGVSHDSLLRWSTARVSDEEDAPLKYPDFCVAYNIAKELQKAFLVDNGLQGNSPPATTIFVLKNVTDMTDRQIIETKDTDLEAKRDALDKFIDTISNDIKPKSADEG